MFCLIFVVKLCITYIVVYTMTIYMKNALFSYFFNKKRKTLLIHPRCLEWDRWCTSRFAHYWKESPFLPFLNCFYGPFLLIQITPDHTEFFCTHLPITLENLMEIFLIMMKHSINALECYCVSYIGTYDIKGTVLWLHFLKYIAGSPIYTGYYLISKWPLWFPWFKTQFKSLKELLLRWRIIYHFKQIKNGLKCISFSKVHVFYCLMKKFKSLYKFLPKKIHFFWPILTKLIEICWKSQQKIFW